MTEPKASELNKLRNKVNQLKEILARRDKQKEELREEKIKIK